ncbi:MAG: putative membrane protein [uncultured Nocardioidaceae bacterium]|uniref:Putative membrane protein n=1 Tax=uncultured Nocardioidaceae bacterium TaxID=253824 RepID=A0A6J4LX42_9ACTN|nr:MAG: putative membrane protein [uncultured Nocardioidaceae bacterium]
MAGGLFALLDDVAAMAKLAAASVDDIGAAATRAGLKSAGVVVDDTAVTPQYVSDVTPDRELPIIRKIATGSLRNKLFFILPAILLMSQYLEWLITPLLMLGATYLCFEGAEKLLHAVRGHDDEHGPAVVDEAVSEDSVISGAIRTDFILSAEIMVIALDEVSEEPFVTRALILVAVAVAITVLVYGVVALIVKMDDVGLSLSKRASSGAQRIGRGLVRGMPLLLKFLSVVGVAAMLWVGGHILLIGLYDLGWHPPYDLVHHAEEVVHEATGALGGLLGWSVNTLASAVVGLVVGAVVVAVMHVLPIKRTH